AVEPINGRLLIPQFGSSAPVFILRKSFTKASSTGSPMRCSCQKQSWPESKMYCPILKSQRNGWRCFVKSRLVGTPAQGSSWRHAQVSIKLHRNVEALNLRLFNSGAERPRRWKSFSNDSRPAVMNASHKSQLV